MKVFVYGTLKRNEGNHRLLKDAKFVCEDSIKGYTLFDLFYGFPCVVKMDLKNNYIYGEVYEIDSEILKSLDMLEGYTEGSPNNHYERVEEVTLNGYKVYLYRYENFPQQGIHVKDGAWSSLVHYNNMTTIYDDLQSDDFS